MGHVCEATQAMTTRQPEPPRHGASAHYFDTEPHVASQPVQVSVDVGDLRFDLDTDRGVFSHGRLDTGTELLLRRGGSPRCAPGDHLLDLGCGSGVIALVLAQRAPQATVWAVDVNERARGLCQSNAQRLGCSGVRVANPHEVPDDVRFTEIWSNPPIRIGKAALHDLLTHWLGRLTSTGRAMLVVHRHLGADSLATWLGDTGWHVERRASSKGYRLLQLQPGRIDHDTTP
jgi:16S rRNA (guanine1207-N2)-methyltransferase